ncbi:MAG TPA: hypothetical protein VGB85_03135 [Nannocystis sp.]
MARATEALAGLGVAALLFAGARALLRDSAQGEPFRVEVEVPARVVASSEGLRWQGTVRPATLAERVEVWVDGVRLEASNIEGQIAADLHAVGPGHHLVELAVTQQGGRTQTVTDTLLVGPFAAVQEDCALSLTVAEAAIQRLLIPPLRERLLAAAREDPLLGPGTTLERAELTLLVDAVRVRVTLAGINTIAVDAFLKLQPAGQRGLALSLGWLGPVEFFGKLRTQATLGGAAVGAALTGPLAPLGAVAGYVLADRYVGKRAHAEVREQLRRGLEQVASVPLLPSSAELLPGHPRSAVTLAFCGPVTIAPGVGISTRLSLRSPAPGGAVYRGVVLPEPDPSDMSDVRLDLSIDAVNALLHAWTANGLLADRMAAAQWVGQVDRALQEWTLLSLVGVTVTRAPVLMAADQGNAAPRRDAWALSFGGLVLDLRGGEHAGTVVAAGRGWITPELDAGSGRLELGGVVDRLRLTCIEGQVLTPCFGALLELGEVESRLDASLAPGTGRLPGIDVRGLLRTRTRALRPEGLDVEELTVTVPAGHPGVLRVRARLRP